MQEYKLVIRSIVGGATQLDFVGNVLVQNAGEFTAYLNEQFLAKGWTLLSSNLIRVIPPTDTAPVQYEFAYHLVREVVEPVAKSAK